MSDETAAREIARQIETYSNAIVAFAVLQALGYSYSFGTSELFNCLVKTSDYLAIGLAVAFVIATVVMAIAVLFLGRTMQSLSGEFAGIVNKIYRAKTRCRSPRFYDSNRRHPYLRRPRLPGKKRPLRQADSGRPSIQSPS
jgi:hypothetical protein